ncbi:MAG: GspE/PulE family protein [bacterium]|nr:GspE/PulE family protein [bacterium]
MLSNDNRALKERLKKAWSQSQERLVKTQAVKGNRGYVDLKRIPISTEALGILEEKRARELKMAIFADRNKDLFIAVANPEHPETKAEIQKLEKQGYKPKVFISSGDSLEYAWSFYRFVPKNTAQVGKRMEVIDENLEELSSEIKTREDISNLVEGKIQTGSIGDVLEVLLAGALSLRASDLHIETEKGGAKIRYRIDGVLQDLAAKLNSSAYRLTVSRIKLLASLQINITSKSQDGRFSFTLGQNTIELRVSIIPSEYGETIVIRVLDPRIIQLKLNDLGMRRDDLEMVEKALKTPNGMILNTGPTGSGKTTTLYAFLKKIATSEKKIITIEDPIEYHLDNIEQTQVDKKKGYTFANGLEAIMRQDPDIILVGEIRDTDTAATAVQAALTGHLVFSTLHTNSSSGVIPRLLHLGAPAGSIGAALHLIIAQRLVRRLCLSCKEKQQIDQSLQEKISAVVLKTPQRAKGSMPKELSLYKAKEAGCKECGNTGYKGRIGIYELLYVNEDMEFLIEKNAGEAEISKFAREKGMVTLQQDALIKTLLGITSIEELEKVTGPLEG